MAKRRSGLTKKNSTLTDRNPAGLRDRTDEMNMTGRRTDYDKLIGGVTLGKTKCKSGLSPV